MYEIDSEGSWNTKIDEASLKMLTLIESALQREAVVHKENP